MIQPLKPSRRTFLRQTAGLAVAGVTGTLAAPALATISRGRNLAFNHTHTHEKLALQYASGDAYLPRSLNRLNHFLRDHYSGAVGVIDPGLFDLLHRVSGALGTGTSRPFHVISGYRHPETNNRLHTTRGGGVAKRSLHMEGKAIDVRLPGVPLAELRDAALSLKAGGVGFYPGDQFVHIDTGKVRSW